MIKQFSITKVVTRNIVTDMFQGVRNIFGLRLRGYEFIINKTTKELIEEIKIKYPDTLWWKLSINPLTSGSCMVTIYGEYNE